MLNGLAQKTTTRSNSCRRAWNSTSAFKVPAVGFDLELVADVSNGRRDLLSLSAGVAARAFACDDSRTKCGRGLVARRRDRVGTFELPEDFIAVFAENL